MKTYQPQAAGELPPLLMTSEPGSFAEKTIIERKPQLIARVLADNAYPPDIVHALHAFTAEIAGEPVAPLLPPDDPALAEDIAFWNWHWKRVEGRTWRDLPWYFAETWFYRRLLQDVHYLEEGPWHHHDPFAVQKRAQEKAALAHLALVWDGIQSLPVAERFDTLLHGALWGNRADLSNLTVRENAQPGLATREEEHNLLIDDTIAVHRLVDERPHHIAIINDNVGSDSLFDLALADYLLYVAGVQQVTFHLKDRPFFVSDAMPSDIVEAITALAAYSHAGLQALGMRLQAALDSRRLKLDYAPFWTRCLFFHVMPTVLMRELERADLVILKGDVNYRRLLGDRHWPHTTSMETVTRFFPRPFVALRTLKGEIMVGLQPGVAESLQAQEPDWLINGKRGIIHLVQDHQ